MINREENISPNRDTRVGLKSHPVAEKTRAKFPHLIDRRRSQGSASIDYDNSLKCYLESQPRTILINENK